MNWENIEINYYIPNIIINGFYYGDFEISECVHLFNINIIIFIKIKNNNTKQFEYIQFYENHNNIHKNKALLLLFKNNNNHYEIILYEKWYTTKVINITKIENEKEKNQILKKNKIQNHINSNENKIVNDSGNINAKKIK